MARLLKVGIVGAGASGAMHAEALRNVTDAVLLAVADVDLERADAFAAKWGVQKAYDSAEKLCADPEVDVIHVCTPPFLHGPGAMAAIRAGKPVIIEKPIARTVAEAMGIVQAAREGGVLLAGVFQHRFMHLPNQLREAVQQGKLGRLYLCDAYVKWWRDESYFQASPWRGTMEFEGGGALINQAIHTIDLLLWLVGPVSEIRGEIATLAHSIEAEDVAVATLRFRNGALGVIEATTTAWPGFAERIELHGSAGSAILNEGEGWIEWLFKGEETRRSSEGNTGTGASDPTKISLVGHTAEFEDFYRAVREGRAALVDGEQAIQALQVIEAIRLSSDGRQSVSL